MFLAINESSPDVGSSSSIILGLVISSTPIAVLLRSPPEIDFLSKPPIYVSAHFWRPKSL